MNCPFTVDHLATKRANGDTDSEELKDGSAHLLVDKAQVVVDVLGNWKIEEDVERGQCEVVDEAEEVDADGSRRGKGRYDVCCICCEH